MKSTQLFFVSLIFFLCAVPLFSQTAPPGNPPEFTPLVFAEAPGSYAIYRDTRFGETAYIGVCSLGGNQLALRMYVPSTKAELLVTQTFYTVPNANDPDALDVEPGTIDLVRGDFAASDSTRRMLPMIYNWMNAWLHSRARFEDAPEYTFEEDGLYNFQYWIPVLQMKDMDSVTLITAGVVETSADSAFFGYAGEGEIAPGPDVVISPGKERAVTLSGLSLPLDENWTLGGDGVYRISVATEQDAYCTVETMNMEEFGNTDTFDLIKLFILYSGATLLPEGLRIFVVDENPCLFYRVYDAQTGKVTVQYKLFVPRDRKSLSVVSFGAFESVYDANRDFFDAIFF